MEGRAPHRIFLYGKPEEAAIDLPKYHTEDILLEAYETIYIEGDPCISKRRLVFRIKATWDNGGKYYFSGKLDIIDARVWNCQKSREGWEKDYFEWME